MIINSNKTNFDSNEKGTYNSNSFRDKIKPLEKSKILVNPIKM